MKPCAFASPVSPATVLAALATLALSLTGCENWDYRKSDHHYVILCLAEVVFWLGTIGLIRYLPRMRLAKRTGDVERGRVFRKRATISAILLAGVLTLMGSSGPLFQFFPDGHATFGYGFPYLLPGCAACFLLTHIGWFWGVILASILFGVGVFQSTPGPKKRDGGGWMAVGFFGCIPLTYLMNTLLPDEIKYTLLFPLAFLIAAGHIGEKLAKRVKK